MDDPLIHRITYLDGANLQRIEGRVSFIEDGKAREVVVEATDGSAAFIPAHLLVGIDLPLTDPEPARRAVEWATQRGRYGERHTHQSRPWDEGEL